MRFLLVLVVVTACDGAAPHHGDDDEDAPPADPDAAPDADQDAHPPEPDPDAVAQTCDDFPAGGGPSIHVVYLVPTDRSMRSDYVATLEHAIHDLQLWYAANSSDGRTFRVASPSVAVVFAPHDSTYYSTHDPGTNWAYYFWQNVTSDAFDLTGGGFDQPDARWILYIDADPGCEQVGGGGTSGVAVLPANDLRGLANEPRIDPCGLAPDDSPRCRWVGGLGHELGHALDLPHPPECEDGDPETWCDDSALLWTGYATYPEAHFTAMDLAWLDGSPFIDTVDLPDCSIDCSVP